MPGRFTLKRDANGKFQFTFIEGEGQVLASSEPYESRSAALDGIESVRSDAPDAEVEDGQGPATRDPRPRRRYPWRQAVAEFLWLPLLIIGGFLVFTAAMVAVELAAPVGPLQQALQRLIPAQAISTLLPAIATSLVVAASITFSLLLMAVQQQASKYTQIVFDQFLRRRTNQVSFGFFVGLALYCLALILFVSSRPIPAVLSATLALVLTVVALTLLVVLIYVTVDQMRPTSVASTIQTMAQQARRRQTALLSRCRSRPELAGKVDETVARAGQIGYVVDIDVDTLATGLTHMRGDVEIELHARLGSYLVVGEAVAEIRGGSLHERETLANAVLDAVTLARMRDIDTDPGHGVDQLGNMAWTLGSTGTQDPEGALIAVRALRGLLAEWSTSQAPAKSTQPLPIVYHDRAVHKIIGSLLSELVVSTESAQYHVCAEVLDTFAAVFAHLSPNDQQVAAEGLQGLLPSVSRHAFTFEIASALAALHQALTDAGYTQIAACAASVKDQLRENTSVPIESQDVQT